MQENVYLILFSNPHEYTSLLKRESNLRLTSQRVKKRKRGEKRKRKKMKRRRELMADELSSMS